MDTAKRSISIKKVLFIVLNVLFYSFILLMLLFAIANIKVKRTDDIPNIFGRGFLSVQSDSMNGNRDDSFKKGDLIFVKMLDEDDMEKLNVGDVITFYDTDLTALNTHRIVDKDPGVFIVQGDLVALDDNRKYDPDGENDSNYYQAISYNEVKALHLSTWGGAGSTYDFIVDNFEWTIVLPVALIVILEIVLLVRNILSLNNAKLKEKYEKEKLEDLGDLEAAKEEMRKQILEELKKEQEEKEEAPEK